MNGKNRKYPTDIVYSSASVARFKRSVAGSMKCEHYYVFLKYPTKRNAKGDQGSNRLGRFIYAYGRAVFS